MAKTFPQDGRTFPSKEPGPAPGALDRLASFRVTYVAIFAFVLLFMITLWVVEASLTNRFQALVTQAAGVDPTDGPVALQIQRRVAHLLQTDPWISLGGVRVTPIILGADGWTPLYVGGPVPLPPDLDPLMQVGSGDDLLPASVTVVVSVPLDTVLASTILVVYGALLMQFLFLYTRAVSRRDQAALDLAISDRIESATRTERIQHELDEVRNRLTRVEPLEESHVVEISTLRAERAALQAKLETLVNRERELTVNAGQTRQLEDERQALEDLLEEAVTDLESRDQAIHTLESSLKKAARSEPRAGRAREVEQLKRRLRTLYKNLEIDDRAITELVALRDEGMKLKAEEHLKRLSDDSESAAVRRKVGGLPPHLSIFELGFAGKGRIYYMRGSQRRFRVLTIGAKNSQKTDLEYLSRLK